MAWIMDRLREDNTRSAIGQLSILAVLLALLLGVDVNALLTQAEASAARITVLGTSLAGIAAQLARFATPPPPPALPVLPPEVVRGLQRLGANMDPPG